MQSVSPGAAGLNTIEIDTIGEILNISMGAAATAVSLMLSRQVVITTPSVRVIESKDFDFSRLEPAMGIEIRYKEGLHGSNIMIMSVKDARAIVGLLLQDTGGEESVSDGEMDELQISALGEIMNQMMGASSTALATFLNRSIDISPPESFGLNDSPERLSPIHQQAYIVTVSFQFQVEGLLDSEFITVMPVDFTKELVQSAMSMGESASDGEAVQDDGGVTGHRQVPTPVYEADYPDEAPRVRKKAAEPAPARTPPPPPRRVAPPPEPAQDRRAPRKSVEVAPLQFANLDPSEEYDAEQVNLDLVMDIDLSVVVEIGRIKKLVKEIVALRAGSIIELEKQAGEPVDIMVNGKLIARGDVVVIDDNFGVRVTEIVGSLSRP